MRKILQSMRALIAACLLLGGVNFAWATEVPYNVGSSTSDVWGTGFSDVWTLTGDGAVTVTFTNHCATDGNWWENWQLFCGNDSYGPEALVDANNYFKMRSDRWDDAAGNANGFFVSDGYFTDFKTFQNGATVTLKIVRYGATVNVYTSVTKDATTRTMTYVKTGLDGTLNFFLTQSLSYMQITAQNVSTDVAGETMTNAYFSFTDATITSNTVIGEVGSMSWAGQWTATPSIDNNMFRVGNMNDGTIALVGEAAGDKDIVTITFDLAYVGLQKKEIQFKVTDKNDLVLVDEQVTVQSHVDWPAQFFANTLGFELSDFVYQAANNPGMVNNTKNSFTLTFNYATQKIHGTITNKNGTVNKQIDMPVGAAAVKSFAVRSNYNNESRRAYFDNLKITTEIGNYAAVATTYTVQYKSGGTEIKTAATGRVGDVGATPVLEAGDTETFYSVDGEHKYVYASDDASTTTIATGGTTVVTVNFTDYEKRDYTVNAVDKANNETVLGEITSGYVYADAISATVNTPWYVLYNGTLYNKSGNSETFDVTSDGMTKPFEYEATEITNVVFYSEGEDLTGVTKVTNSIASKKGIARIPNETTFANLGAGSYTVYIRAHAGNSSGGTAIFKAGDVEFARNAFSGSKNNQDFNANFALTEATDVKIKYDSGNATGLDYIYVVKNGNDPVMPITVTAAGMATYVPAFNLDFSGTTLKAYKVKVNSKAIATLTALDEVPAGTPVLLIGATENVPVIESAAVVSDNDLVAGTGAAVATIDGAYTNMILNNVNDKIGFYFAAGQTVATNRAYLHIDSSLAPDAESAGARMLMVFSDESTGISNIGAAESKAEGYYNLSGQRVAKPTKGLYIVNGKKVIIK